MSSLFLKNGYIVDGTGNPGFVGSIFIREERIKEIYEGAHDIIADESIDATGMVIAPGFIDMNSHSDVSSLSFSKADSKICQGVTTEIVGGQGWSAFPSVDNNIVKFKKNRTDDLVLFEEHYYWDSIDSYGQAVIPYGLYSNMGTFIGYSTLRRCAMGTATQYVVDIQVKEMCNILERELLKGAFGMSVEWDQLEQYPLHVKEVKALSKIVAKHQGVLAVNLRIESGQILKTMKEIISIAQETGVHLHFSGIEVRDVLRNRSIVEAISSINKARNKGVIITCDQFIYDTVNIELFQLIPTACKTEELLGLTKRLAQPDAILFNEISNEIKKYGGADQIIIAGVGKYFSAFRGKSLAMVAMLAGISSEEVVIKLLISSDRPMTIRIPSLDLSTIGAILQEKFVTVASDGAAYPYDSKSMGLTPHPSSFGTFPRFIELVRRQHLMEIEEAIYKITKLPADILKLTNRGVLEKGSLADVVIFDYDGCHDNADFNNPFQLPSGIGYVIVGGKVEVRNGQSINQRNGVILYHR